CCARCSHPYLGHVEVSIVGGLWYGLVRWTPVLKKMTNGYHFKELNESYLFNKTSWDECTEPKNIVMWNVVLFSMLLGLSALEFVLCAIQTINALMGVLCGDCRKKGKNDG
ncbi:hypothetical protein GDO86_019593, partial [Hymenochirus boettgeri]